MSCKKKGDDRKGSWPGQISVFPHCSEECVLRATLHSSLCQRSRNINAHDGIPNTMVRTDSICTIAQARPHWSQKDESE